MAAGSTSTGRPPGSRATTCRLTSGNCRVSTLEMAMETTAAWERAGTQPRSSSAAKRSSAPPPSKHARRGEGGRELLMRDLLLYPELARRTPRVASCESHTNTSETSPKRTSQPSVRRTRSPGRNCSPFTSLPFVLLRSSRSQEPR